MIVISQMLAGFPRGKTHHLLAPFKRQQSGGFLSRLPFQPHYTPADTSPINTHGPVSQVMYF